MKVIITITLCYNNVWKSKFMAVEKPDKLTELFFSYFVATPSHITKLQLNVISSNVSLETVLNY